MGPGLHKSTWERTSAVRIPAFNKGLRAPSLRHQFQLGGLWNDGIALVEVSRPCHGGDGDLLPVVAQLGGVCFRTAFDICRIIAASERFMQDASVHFSPAGQAQEVENRGGDVDVARWGVNDG